METINNIIIVESSNIISEGLLGLLTKNNSRQQVVITDSLEKANVLIAKMKCNIIIINPSFFQNNRTFNAFKNQYENIKIAALVYAYFEDNFLSKFDTQVTISDTIESINAKINSLFSDKKEQDQNNSQDILSEREIDVLKLLATGMPNKEIADKLNISIHTAITHRKNITQKTGIKSISGLTIYAVLQKLISTDDITF